MKTEIVPRGTSKEKNISKSFSLYQLANNYQNAYNILISDHDLPDECINDTLEGLEGEIKEKSIQIAIFYKNMEAFLEGMKNAEKEMSLRIKSMKNKMEKLKDYLKQNIEKCGIESITDCPYFAIKIQNSVPSVNIEEGANIPQKYLRTKTFIEPDKRLIMKALKYGEKIEGASITQNKILTIK